MSDKPTPDAVLREARALIGVPWRHQGRDPRIGVDCVGFIVVVLARLGVAVEDRTRYRRRTDGIEILSICDRYAARIPISDVRPGDAIVFAYNGGPDHMAFVGDESGRLTLIHSYWPHKRIVEHGLTDEFLRHAVAAYRFTEEPSA